MLSTAGRSVSEYEAEVLQFCCGEANHARLPPSRIPFDLQWKGNWLAGDSRGSCGHLLLRLQKGRRRVSHGPCFKFDERSLGLTSELGTP